MEEGPSLSCQQQQLENSRHEARKVIVLKFPLFQQWHLRPKREKKYINDNKIHAEHFLHYTKDYHLHFLSETIGLNCQDY